MNSQEFDAHIEKLQAIGDEAGVNRLIQEAQSASLARSKDLAERIYRAAFDGRDFCPSMMLTLFIASVEIGSAAMRNLAKHASLQGDTLSRRGQKIAAAGAYQVMAGAENSAEALESMVKNPGTLQCMLTGIAQGSGGIYAKQLYRIIQEATEQGMNP